MFMTFSDALARLADSRIPLSRANVFVLSRMTREEEGKLREVWPQVADERRCDIARSLVSIAEASVEVDFNAFFRYCLGDPHPLVRCSAVDGLWEDEDVAIMHRLAEMALVDEAESVRAAAAASLGRFALLAELEELEAELGSFVRDTLLKVIRNGRESTDVRRRALESVAYFLDDEVRSLIETAYYDLDEKMRLSAVFAMGRSADRYWTRTVVGELSGDNPEIRFEAARASGELGIQRAIHPLIDLLSDPDREIQEAAIWSLGQIGGPEARRALLDCCASYDEGLREAAEEALAELELGQGMFAFSLFEFGLDDDEEEELDEDFGDSFGLR